MENYKNGFRLVIERDYECSHNPEEDECLGKIVCFHKRYVLGDKHEFYSPQELNNWLKNNENKLACVLPIYMYDHTSLAFSTTPFSCPFDSGQLGYIYVKNEKVRQSFCQDNVPKQKIEEVLKQELQDYQKYINGEQEFYRYAIYDSKNKQINSCTGFELIDNNFEELTNSISEHIDEKYHFLIKDIQEKKQVQTEQE